MDEKTEQRDPRPQAPMVLLVDDEPSIIQIMERALMFSGYRVLLASRGEEAVELYRKNQGSVSVVVLDRTMPDMAGERVLELLEAINAGVKVIFTSGYEMGPETQAILSRGGHDFLPKPFGIKELVKKIRKILERDGQKPISME